MSDRLEQAIERRHELAKRRNALQRRLDRIRGRIKAVARRIVRIRSRRKRLWTKTVGFDGTPMFLGHKLILQWAREHGWTGYAVSGDRRKGVAERFGKSSQAALYDGWQKGLPGYNPANPPGRSTHELASDGVAYEGPVGRELKPWQLGLDVGDAGQLVEILRKAGLDIRRPYSDPREAHHVNLYEDPTPWLIKRGLC